MLFLTEFGLKKKKIRELWKLEMIDVCQYGFLYFRWSQVGERRGGRAPLGRVPAVRGRGERVAQVRPAQPHHRRRQQHADAVDHPSRWGRQERERKRERESPLVPISQCYSRIRLHHPRDRSSSRLYWPSSVGTEFRSHKISGYIIQPSGYIGHFERCEREHWRA